MIEYLSENSLWEIDEEKMRYRRTPRENGIVHVGSPRLEYGIWHPLKNFEVDRPWLTVRRTDAVHGIRTFIGWEDDGDQA